MKNTLYWLLVQCCVFTSTHVISQTVPVWEIYNMSNSPMPDNTVRCLQMDHENNLWIGTDNGLAKLNGDTWEIFNETNSGLADNYVRALAVDQNNVLWVGSTLGGVQKFDGTTWTTYNTLTSDIPDNFIRTITIDRNGNKWIGTVEGLTYFNDTIWKTWQMVNSPILTNNISSIGIGLQNEKFIGTINGGVIYMDADTNITGIYTILNANLPDNSALKVQVDSLGKPWYAGSAGGLFTDTGNQTWMAFNWQNSGLPTNSMTTMKLDNENNFYLGTQQCGLIIRRFDQSWEYYNTGNSEIPENYIISLEKDTIGNFAWIGTFSKGLVKLREDHLGLSESNETMELTVSPNPVQQGQIVYFNTVFSSPKITLMTTDGKIIAHENFDHPISTFHLPEAGNGSYILLVEENNRTSTVRLLIL